MPTAGGRGQSLAKKIVARSLNKKTQPALKPALKAAAKGGQGPKQMSVKKPKQKVSSVRSLLLYASAEMASVHYMAQGSFRHVFAPHMSDCALVLCAQTQIVFAGAKPQQQQQQQRQALQNKVRIWPSLGHPCYATPVCHFLQSYKVSIHWFLTVQSSHKACSCVYRCRHSPRTRNGGYSASLPSRPMPVQCKLTCQRCRAACASVAADRPASPSSKTNSPCSSARAASVARRHKAGEAAVVSSPSRSSCSSAARLSCSSKCAGRRLRSRSVGMVVARALHHVGALRLACHRDNRQPFRYDKAHTDIFLHGHEADL